MRSACAFGAVVFALSMMACSSDDTGGGEDPSAEGCEPSSTVCAGDDVNICNLAGTSYVFSRACGPVGTCVAGVCVGGDEGEGEGGDGGDEGVDPSGEGEGGGGDAGEGEGDGGDGGEGEGEAVAGEGEGEGVQGEGEGEGEGDGGDEGAGEGEGGDGGDEGGGEGEGEVEPPECEENRDCPGRQLCDQELLECEEGAGCEGDIDCLDDRRCYDGLCNDPCVENADCPGSRSCQDGICPEPAICFGPDDCNQGRICRAGVCEQGCEAPGDCPGRQQCDVDAGRCIEPEVCEENADCVGERLCHVARCVPPCDDDGDCPGTRHCNPDRRLCLEPAFCVVPADCDPGRRCNRGTCRGVCEGPDDCPGNQRCNAGQGLCEEAGACNDDDDCLGARVCLGERCRPSCVQDGCEGQQVCDEGDGHCQEPEVCLGNIDCVGDRVCGPGGDCYDRGCAGHADCEGGDDCVDHLCAAPLGPACAADVDCEGDRVCAPAGVCVLGGPCGDDAECPGAAGVCGAGACVQCVADDDCAVTEGCADGRCVYHGGCEQDLDCRGDRTCEDLDCAAADCEADRFDGGDELPVLWTATYTGLRLCDGDEDRYRTTVLPDQGLIVTLRHDGGDLSLELFDAANPFEPLAAADGPWGLEQLSVPPSPAPLELEISVRGGMGASPDYTLDLRSAGEGVCARDAFEGLLGNDQRARASVIGLGDFALEICPADVDWLAVDLVAGSRLDVAAEAAQGNDGLSLSLHAPNGELLEEGEDSPFGLAAATDARLPGRYLIRVALDDDEAQASVRLQVSVLASNNSESDACRHVPELAPGEPVRWAPGAAVHRFELSCGDPFAPDFAATFELPQQAVVTLSAVGATAVALRTECAARPSERGCVEDPDPVLGPIPLDAGTYTIIAHSFDGRPPTLDLDVAIFCGVDGDCPDDDVCDGGQCHALCQGDDDCTGAQRCGDGGHCDEPDVCAEDDDCVGLRECRYDGACFVADCDLHADCEGACVDRVCADAAPRACSEDGDCDAGLVCAPVGACVRADPCGDNDDCPAGAPICDGGECVVCRGGQGCSAAEACGGGRCRFVGFCEEDGDCPGTRTCDGGDCVAGGDCDGDRYDADDGPFRVLGLRTYGGLVRCDGTTDVYSTNLPAGQALRATLVHDPAVGDLSLALELPGPPPEELASSDQPHGVEVVTVGPFPDDQDLNVVVGGRRGFDVPYSVSLRRADPDECPADGHEGLLGNDSLARATGVRVGQVEHEICEGDEDWFAISLQAGTALTATSAVAGPAGDLLVSIVDSEGGGLADGEPGPDGVQARAIAETPGSYGIRVRAANDAVRAEATLDVVAAPAPNASALACAHATEVILDGPAVQLGPGPAVERFAVPCGLGMPGLSADFLWTLDLARDETVDIRARDAEAVLVRSACDDAGSDVTCGLPGSPEIEELELEAGRYWVIVQTTGGLRPSVRVVRSE